MIAPGASGQQAIRQSSTSSISSVVSQRARSKLFGAPFRRQIACSFSKKLLTERKPSTGAKPLEYAAAIAFEWEELKSSDASFENKLQLAWTATMDHLLTEVFTGDLKAAVGDVIATDRHLIDSPQKLIEKIQECAVR